MPATARELQEFVEGLLTMAYDVLQVERFGTLTRAKSSEWVMSTLSPVLVEEVISRNSGKFPRRDPLLGRYHYLRAAALWFSGDEGRAKKEYAEAKRLLGSCKEKELCDGATGLNR